MSFQLSTMPTPDIGHPLHSTKRSRLTPRERQPPKLKRRTFKANKVLFTHDACGISFQSSGSDLPNLSKLHKQSSNMTYFSQNFDNVCLIGEGSFGEVYRVRCKGTGRYYAVKRSKERFRSEMDRKMRLEEVRRHELIPKHGNCVEFVGAWEEDDYLYIQLELCRTSLEEYTQIHHEITDDMLWNILLDILLAVKHLHDHDLLHLDIKLENILVALSGCFKLGDFGLVFDISKGNVKDAVEGDPKYLAPELMTGHFTKAADIFSLGITMLELASDLNLPSRGPLWHELRNGIFPDEHTKHICPELFDLIKLMTTPDYVERPTVDTLLSHPHLTKMIMKRRRLHYMEQVVSQVQSLYHLGRAALKSVVDIVLLPLGYLNNGSRHVCTSDRFISNDSAGSRFGEYESSYSEVEIGERIAMNNSSETGFSNSPNVSPIKGERRTFLNMSVPELLITNSTPTCSPPVTPRKRNFDSLHGFITPITTRSKRLCISNNIPSFNLQQEDYDSEDMECYQFTFSRSTAGARNLLPVFRTCED